jgi:spoIIIJ-associated protein
MTNEDIKNLIKELIDKTIVKTTDITVAEEDPNNTWFSITVNEPHFFINHDGEALQALNHLVKRIVESKDPSFLPSFGENKNKGKSFLIDINDFQKKKVEAVKNIAHMMAERARYFKSNIEVDPMSSFERRIVHEFLSTMTDLKTESVGFGPTRRVVIKYIGAI